MPEVEQWGRGRPSQAKIDKMVEQIRAGYTLPEGMKIPESVQDILNPPAVEESPFDPMLDDVLPDGPEVDTQTGVPYGAEAVEVLRDSPLIESLKDKPQRRSAKRDAEEARTAHVVRVRTADDYRPLTDPGTIRSMIANYYQFKTWYDTDRVSEAAFRMAEMHVLRIPQELLPEELRNKS